MADGDTLNVVWQWLPPAGLVTVVVILSAYLFLTRKKDGGEKDLRVRNEAAVSTRGGVGEVLDAKKSKVKHSVVFINAPSCKGSGFIAALDVVHNGKKKWLTLLITCNHVLPSLLDAMKSDIYFGKVDDEVGTLIRGKDLFGKFFKTDIENPVVQFPAPWPSDMKRFDYTAVEVNKNVMEEKLNEVPEPLQLAKFAELMRKEDLPKVNDMISIVHYPKEKNFVRCENPEVIKVLDGPYIGHIATTRDGSSGSPVLRQHNNDWIVVGLHRGVLTGKMNFATLTTVLVDAIQGKKYTGKTPDARLFVEAKMESAETELPPSPPERPPPSSPSTALPSAEKVLEEFRDRFIEVMEPDIVASALRKGSIIPDGCEAQISPPDRDRKQRNEILHDRLVRGCTREALIDACDIFIAKDGYPNMNALGRAMKEKLAPATADPVEVLDHFQELFLNVMEPDIVASALRKGNIIPDGCEAQISPPDRDRKQRNEILHDRLVRGCTREALIDACNIFIAKDGYPNMNALGRAMKKKLETGE